MFVIYWDAKTQTLHGLNASGRSPYAINRDVFATKNLDQIPLDGPLSWSVPGCVDGWFELHDKFGKQSFAEIWNNEHYRSLRAALARGERPTRSCKTCYPQDLYNIFLLKSKLLPKR